MHGLDPSLATDDVIGPVLQLKGLVLPGLYLPSDSCTLSMQEQGKKCSVNRKDMDAMTLVELVFCMGQKSS